MYALNATKLLLEMVRINSNGNEDNNNINNNEDDDGKDDDNDNRNNCYYNITIINIIKMMFF